MDKPRHQRKLMRLYQYDYSQNGVYLVTICTANRREYFGRVKDEKMIFSWYGQLAADFWQKIPSYYKNVNLDEYMIMPNHIHGIIIINSPTGVAYDFSRDRTVFCPYNFRYGLLSKIIKSFKEAVVKQIHKKFNDYNFSWQRSFHDHILREEESLWAARDYIRRNPAKWTVDRNNPRFIKK